MRRALACLLVGISSAANAQPIDSGPAGPITDASIAIVGSDSEVDAHVAAAREAAARVTERGEAQIADEETGTAQEALAALEAKRELTRYATALAETRLAQIRYETVTTKIFRALNRARKTFGRVAGQAIAGPPLTGVADPRYADLSAALADSRRLATTSISDAWKKIEPAPAPPPLDQASAALVGEEAAASFRPDAEQLSQAIAGLEHKRRQALRSALAYYTQQSSVLTSIFAATLRRSPVLKSQLRGIRTEVGDELGGEAVQTGVRLGGWLTQRAHQLRRLPSLITTGTVATFVWELSKFALLLIVLMWALRRWSSWMQAAVEVIGRSASYGSSALLLVRFAEAGKQFGPPLLVFLSALASYNLFSSVWSELDLVLQLLIAVSALRVQLRLVEAIGASLQRRRAEREREQQLLDAERARDEAEPDKASAPEQPDRADDSEAPQFEPFWPLVVKTWRRLTRYVSVFVVLLVVTKFAVGRGVFYGVLLRWAWLGAIPLTLFVLRTWRARIVYELNVRAPGAEVPLFGRLAKRHSHRIYGLPIVLAASIIVLGRRLARFAKRHFFELDSTKRVLAFLFRRQVQKHAREHGRVLDAPADLPAEVTAEFGPPTSAELSTPKKKVLPTLLEAYRSWEKNHVDGSVALVGDTGVGKTALISCFEAELKEELGENIASLSLDKKITKPTTLYRWFADELGLENAPTSEEHLVHELRRCKRRVITVDCCHHLFLRQVGGFDAWEAFVRVVNETSSHVFWLLSFGKVAWEYLTNVAGRVVYFRRVVLMPEWSETELRGLILRRMRRAGYRVNFSDLLVTRIQGVQMQSQVIRTSQGYFRLLWDYADGNPTIASYFWLRSLVPEESGKSVRVHLFAAPKIEELEALPDDIVFVLTGVLEHESASANELAEITNLSIELCRFAVRFGREKGYLEVRDRRFVVSRLWRQTIVTFLKRRHLLYS